jgi:carbonic anhydrase/acetyltransferase-like protein (isoleucine patch superfamily)
MYENGLYFLLNAEKRKFSWLVLRTIVYCTLFANIAVMDMIFELEGVAPTIHGDQHFIANNAAVVGDVDIGNCVTIWFNAVLRGDNERIVIGEGSNIQDGCIMHTDPGFPLLIGDRVTVGHNAMLHGCKIGHGSLIGMNAVLMNGAQVGNNCLIGANTLIPEGRKIPDNSLVVGTPGRVIRQLNQDELKHIEDNAQVYIDKIARYQSLKLLD